MAIPEAQLETWSHQGSIAQSSSTYNSIKAVLQASTAPYARQSTEVFLQGSYGNDTNIYAESDVDIVIRLDDCFFSDVDDLTPQEQGAHEGAFTAAVYTHPNFKRDVLSLLKAYYGTAVEEGDKAIAIAANGARRKADVIVASEFRRYYKFRSDAESTYAKGICFFNGQNERIANYPKQHSANLTVKHQNTSLWFKPVARIFKNMRSRLIDAGMIEAGIAPSYFIEGLLYNVPDRLFVSSYQECVTNALNWYLEEAAKNDLLCANEQYYLLRFGAHECWSPQNCEAFVAAAIELWNDW
jgi:hypothetical protein